MLLNLLHLDLVLNESLLLSLILHPFLSCLDIRFMVYGDQLVLVLLNVVDLALAILNDSVSKVILFLDLSTFFLDSFDELVVVLLLLLQDLVGSFASCGDFREEFLLFLLKHFDAILK